MTREEGITILQGKGYSLEESIKEVDIILSCFHEPLLSEFIKGMATKAERGDTRTYRINEDGHIVDD